LGPGCAPPATGGLVGRSVEASPGKLPEPYLFPAWTSVVAGSRSAPTSGWVPDRPSRLPHDARLRCPIPCTVLAWLRPWWSGNAQDEGRW